MQSYVDNNNDDGEKGKHNRQPNTVATKTGPAMNYSKIETKIPRLKEQQQQNRTIDLVDNNSIDNGTTTTTIVSNNNDNVRNNDGIDNDDSPFVVNEDTSSRICFHYNDRVDASLTPFMMRHSDAASAIMDDDDDYHFQPPQPLLSSSSITENGSTSWSSPPPPKINRFNTSTEENQTSLKEKKQQQQNKQLMMVQQMMVQKQEQEQQQLRVVHTKNNHPYDNHPNFSTDQDSVVVVMNGHANQKHPAISNSTVVTNCTVPSLSMTHPSQLHQQHNQSSLDPSNWWYYYFYSTWFTINSNNDTNGLRNGSTNNMSSSSLATPLLHQARDDNNDASNTPTLDCEAEIEGEEDVVVERNVDNDVENRIITSGWTLMKILQMLALIVFIVIGTRHYLLSMIASCSPATHQNDHLYPQVLRLQHILQIVSDVTIWEPAGAATAARTLLKEHVTYSTQQGLLHPSFNDPISPQSKALYWFITGSGKSIAILPNTTDTIKQLYALMVFSYSIPNIPHSEWYPQHDINTIDEVCSKWPRIHCIEIERTKQQVDKEVCTKSFFPLIHCTNSTTTDSSSTIEKSSYQYISGLYMANANLTGIVPMNELFNGLQYIQTIELNTNPFLQGTIPSAIGIGSSLFEENSNWNDDDNNNNKYIFTENIQEGLSITTIQMLSKTLTSIKLHNTSFSGTVPESSIGHLNMLQELFLDHTNLSGTIPDSVCALPNLHILRVGDNNNNNNNNNSNTSGAGNKTKTNNNNSSLQCLCCKNRTKQNYNRGSKKYMYKYTKYLSSHTP